MFAMSLKSGKIVLCAIRTHRFQSKEVIAVTREQIKLTALAKCAG